MQAQQDDKKSSGIGKCLEKISGNSKIDDIKSDDVKEMFIENGPDETSANFLGGLGGFSQPSPD